MTEKERKEFIKNSHNSSDNNFNKLKISTLNMKKDIIADGIYYFNDNAYYIYYTRDNKLKSFPF